MADQDLQKMPKNAEQFECKYCHFKCSKNSNYTKHCLTNKHLNAVKNLHFDLQTAPKNATPYFNLNPNKYTCLCGNSYKHRQSLYKHKQICQKEKENNTVESKLVVHKPSIPDTDIVLNFVKQIVESNENLIKQQNEKEKNSQEFQMQMFQQMMEFMKQQCATTNNIVNGNVNNNNNYTQFNLQVYLNETCKNAMTVNQFLDYLQPTVEELEATAHLGYVEGISRIIMRGFKNLEEYELPFQCSDLKREHIYVKNPDEEWVEEKDEKPLLLLFIKEVARKNFNNINEWKKKNPNWASYHSKQNDMFMKILNNSVSGGTEEEQQANYEKIIKNIMKNTVIDKSKKNK